MDTDSEEAFCSMTTSSCLPFPSGLKTSGDNVIVAEGGVISKTKGFDSSVETLPLLHATVIEAL